MSFVTSDDLLAVYALPGFSFPAFPVPGYTTPVTSTEKLLVVARAVEFAFQHEFPSDTSGRNAPGTSGVDGGLADALAEYEKSLTRDDAQTQSECAHKLHACLVQVEALISATEHSAADYANRLMGETEELVLRIRDKRGEPFQLNAQCKTALEHLDVHFRKGDFTAPSGPQVVHEQIVSWIASSVERQIARDNLSVGGGGAGEASRASVLKPVISARTRGRYAI